jgi:type II secretory pathway pseudopilin PulG
MIVIEILLVLGIFSVIAMAIYAGYKAGKYTNKDEK